MLVKIPEHLESQFIAFCVSSGFVLRAPKMAGKVTRQDNGNVIKFPRYKRQIMHVTLPTEPEIA